MGANFLELASEYKQGKKTRNSEEIKKLEQELARIASTEDGKTMLAETIGIYLENNMNYIDIGSMILDSKHFNLGERPEFRLKKKGIKAYWIAPNSSTPKTRNYDSTLTMEFEVLSVRPECLLDDIQTGRIDSLLELLQDAEEALRLAIFEKIFTILGQVYNEEKNSAQYFVDTTALTPDTLKKAIRTVTYRNGGVPTILGDSMLVGQITEFDGFAEAIKEEIQRTGQIGTYYGARIFGVPEIYDEAQDKPLFPKDRIYVISSKIGYSATYGDIKSGQETSIEDWTWNARNDKEWGMVVTDPKAMCVIEVKGKEE